MMSAMQPVLGFLPQHVWEVGAGVMAVLLLAQGLMLLIKGPTARGAENMSQRSVRVSGGVILALGVGVGVAALLVNAESNTVHRSDQWGGVGGVVGLGVWIVLLGLSVSFTTGRSKR